MTERNTANAPEAREITKVAGVATTDGVKGMTRLSAAAAAAKNTSALIEDSVLNAEEGVALNKEVVAQLGEIESGVGRAREVMGEIALGSEQQKRSVDEINAAVERMEGVTQATAASAEESASAAEELTSQAGRVQELVGSFKLTHAAAPAADKARTPMSGRSRGSAVPMQGGEPNENGHPKGSGVPNRVYEHRIPFDDDMLGEF